MKKDKDRKKFGLRNVLYLITIVLIIFVFIKINENSSEKAEKTLSPEEFIIKKVEEELGNKTNEEKDRIIDLEYGEFTKLILNGDETLSNKDIKNTFLNNAADVFPIVFKDSSVEKAMITIKTTFVDKYGEKYDDDGIRVMLTRETYDNIKWENFDVNNFEEVADSLYTHLAIIEATKK